MIGVKDESGFIELSADISELIDSIYPVGCLYLSTIDMNPAEIFHIGEWIPFGQDKLLMGVGSKYTQSELTGGNDTINLAHSHTITHTHSTSSHALTVDEIPSHFHYIGAGKVGNVPEGAGFTVPTYNSPASDSAKTQHTGGNKSHTHGSTGKSSIQNSSSALSYINIQNPYITIYMFKRVL